MTELTWIKIDGSNVFMSNTGLFKQINPETKEETMLKTYPNFYGYPTVFISINGERKLKLIHRLLAIAFIPNPHNKPQVNHINGDKKDNRLENLEWCTNKENVEHAFKTGLRKPSTKKKNKRMFEQKTNPKRGEENSKSLLTSKEVAFIKGKRYLLTYQFLANVFGVSRHCIKDIMIGKTWGHLKEEGSPQTTTTTMNLKG